ncbi:MAG: dihydrolipoyllysine-residue succinyltransferase [Chlamydiales bacterium]|nr:dihydrolipoyllysine-residue succinyltransferase [Chlamydiales bacterium]
MVEIKVPSMGESVVQATIGTIIKSSGSVVKMDEEILELETEKVNQVLYASAAGLMTLLVKSGDTVNVGQVIGKIDVAKAETTLSTEDQDPKELSPVAGDGAEPHKSAFVERPPHSLPKARISIEESLQKNPKAPELVPSLPVRKQEGQKRKKMTKLRQTIAQRLVEVKNQTAMLTTFNEVDMSVVMQVREKEQEGFQKKYGVKLGFMSFFVKACVAALQQYPEINARIEGDEIVYFPHFDIGVAVGTEKGLMVPVLRNTEELSYAEIEKQLKQFAEKARSGTISADDLQGGTFTITNGGVYGSLLSTPILNPPQSGILGMHNIVKRPVVVKDEIVIRPMMYLALSYDHRIVDGKEAIGFLVHVKNALEEPARLLLDL